jgi:hypothetical protein
LGDQVETVDDCFQRVVDFMSNRGSQPAGDGEFLGAAQDLLALLLKREVGDEGSKLAFFTGGLGVEKRNPYQDFDRGAIARIADALKGLGGDGVLLERSLDLGERWADRQKRA